MLGLSNLGQPPAEAITFDFDVLIERPVEDVYPLLDWADPRNAKRQQGHKVEGDGRHFALTMESMPDHSFDLEVTEARTDEVYAFSCDIQPRVGRLAHTHERYSFEATAAGHCLLRLVNEVRFIEGLETHEMEYEVMIMSIATNDALAKLKVMAEFGLEAAKAVENLSGL